MPSIRYQGRWPTKSMLGRVFERGIPMEVSQEWVDSARHKLDKYDDLEVIDDANALDDEVPDDGWTRQKIMDWLTVRGLRTRAGLTKKQLMERVRGFTGEEEEEEEIVEEEEEITEEVMDTPPVAEDIEEGDDQWQ